MKFVKLMGLAFFALLFMAVPAFAQGTGGTYVFSGRAIGAGIGAAFTIIGAGYGFGKIGAAALESMARQPEVAGRIQTAMLIIAALLEGATFFSLIVCFGITGLTEGVRL
jgi:F-type H+-transporting ATPase subunit c